MLDRLLKLSIAVHFYLLRSAYTLLLRAAAKPDPWSYLVLMYHLVKAEERQIFARQIEALLKSTLVVPASFVATEASPGKRYASVTFDDGYLSFMENVLPIVHAKGIPVAVFATTGYLAQYPGWINDSTHRCAAERLLGEQELKALHYNKVTIGSHSVSHRLLANLSAEEVLAELQNSKTVLERILGVRVGLFALPFGSYNKEVLSLCEAAGYERVFLGDPLGIWANIDGRIIGRIEVSPSDWRLEFHLKIHGAYQWLPLAIAAKAHVKAFLQKCFRI